MCKWVSVCQDMAMPNGRPGRRADAQLAHLRVSGVGSDPSQLENFTLTHLHTVRPSARIVTTSERKRLADCQRSALVRVGIVPSTERGAYP